MRSTSTSMVMNGTCFLKSVQVYSGHVCNLVYERDN